MKSFIKELTEAYGPTGHEDMVRGIIRKHISKFADEISTDAMGNLIARKGTKTSGGKKIMISGHMDELGLIVTYVEEGGYLRFGFVGGISPMTCVGARVVFADGTKGMVYMEMPEDRSKVVPVEKLFIDIGAKSREDCHIQVGEVCVFDYPFVELGSRLMAKALDDRIGVAVLIESMKSMKKSPNELYYVFSVQEEVGLRGAEVAAYGIDPDIGIAVDVCTSGDPVGGRRVATALGKGGTVKIYDPYLISHTGLVKWVMALAEEKNIPYQREVMLSGGTDSAAIQLTRNGVPVTTLSIPTRYIHSPSEIVEMSDVENAVKLLNAILSSKIDIE